MAANLEKTMRYSRWITNRDEEARSRDDDLSRILIQVRNNVTQSVKESSHWQTLIKINSSYYLEKGLQKLRATEQRDPWTRVAKDLLNRILMVRPVSHCLKRLVLGPCICLLFVVFFFAQVTLHLLNMRLPKFMLNAVALKDLSMTGQQVDLRLQQLYFWPKQYSMLRKQNWANTAETRAYYIR